MKLSAEVGSRTMTIIGIDCATIASKTGLTLAEYDEAILRIKDCRIADSKVPVAEQIYGWIQTAERALLAMDAPLGWPSPMGRALAEHKAGAPIAIKANDLFRRYTDEVVRRTPGKSPLEVGADRIARTARTALSFLADLGVLVGKSIPLAWKARIDRGIYAIEVYPAGTLRVHQRMGTVVGSANTDEKKRSLLNKMSESGTLRFENEKDTAIANEHVLDSVLCAASAVEFLEERVIFPRTENERDLAQKEGWIWVRDAAGSERNTQRVLGLRCPN